MKPHCNPLLKNWNRYLKEAEKFAVLRREGRAIVESAVTAILFSGRRVKKKARR